MRFDLLDGLRGLAALVVVVLHTLLNANMHDALPFGAMAVDFFFCLSGFVICHSYEQKLNAGLNLMVFLKLRVVRLYPMILFGLLIGMGVFGTRVLFGHQRDLIIPGIATFFLNAALLPSPFMPLDYDAAWPLNGSHWSITFELFANAIYGAALFRISGFGFHALTALAATALAVAVLMVGSYDFGWRQHDLYLGVVRVAFPFMIGVSMYRMYAGNPLKLRLGLKPGLLIAATLLACLAMPGAWVNKPIFTLCFLFFIAPALVFFGASVELGPKFSAACHLMGELSYPVYAVHSPIIKFAQSICSKLGLGPTAIAGVYALGIAASLIVAWALLKWADKPVKNLLKNRLFT
jgi:peptidoglycan/LPS O-acetylase OafA/YrhL